MELYSQILDNGGPAFAEILRHVRDRPDEGCLFHCTGGYYVFILFSLISHGFPIPAGKDRTAVIAAIILSVCVKTLHLDGV